MRVYLDTEFDGLGGPLISMALVAEDGREFYEVFQVPVEPQPFVAEHVLPKLVKRPIGPDAFLELFENFLAGFKDGDCEFIADWPADFEHLCQVMTDIGSGQGWRIPLECRMTLLRGSPKIAPEIPHNALSDARALRDWHQSTLEPKPKYYGDARLVMGAN